jgi:hypothetical protein
MVSSSVLACALFGQPATPLPPAQQTATAVWATPGCDLDRLEGGLAWPGGDPVGNTLSGILQLRNSGTTPCRLHGALQVELSDSGGQVLPVAVAPAGGAAPGPESAFVLQPGQAASAAFTWSNWCADPPLGGLFVTIGLADYPGQLTLPAEDAVGMPLSSTPACSAPGDISTLLVEPLRPG